MHAWGLEHFPKSVTHFPVKKCDQTKNVERRSDTIRAKSALMAFLVLAGCDAGPSAVMHDGDGKSPTQPAAAPQAKVTPNDVEEASMPVVGAAAPKEATNYPPLKTPTLRAAISDTSYGDWPLWSRSRKYSADDNAHYQFQKHGSEFGASSYADFLAMAHGFVHSPPKGTQTLKRKNGDTLYYDARDNIFAVATKDGAPRIVFRPETGAAYWDQQKQVEAAHTSRDAAD